MKKKILSFIFAICLILPCAFVFSACDNKSTGTIMHTVTFVYDNGTENSAIQVEEGKFATKPIDPSKVGYTFDGWYIDDFKWGFEYVAVMNDITLTAKWKINTYTINYELNGGANSQSNLSSYTVESNLTFAQPTKDNYEFIGWFIDSELKNEITSTNGYTENLTVYAKWVRINTITYNLNGGTNNTDNPTTFSSAQAVVLKDPTLNNDYLTFTGWFTDEQYEHKITTIPVGTGEDITLWAKWEDIFTIDDKGELSETITGLTEVGKTLKNIKIPSNVKMVGNEAFEGCTNLESISISQNVEILGDYAFYDCVALKTVIFAENCKLTGISRNAFSNCSGLEAITIPSNVQNIGEYAFNSCGKLALIVFETGSQLTNINQNAFNGCSSLTSITIPKSVIKIDELAFKGCSDLEIITFESGSALTYIGINAFSNCRGLTTITIPKSVTKIDECAFNGCYGLETITFESDSGLTYIGSKIFNGCSSLISITIPSSVEMIGAWMFDQLNNYIESVIFEDESTWYKTSKEDWEGSKTEGTKIDVSNSENNVEYVTSSDYLYKKNK